MVHVLEKLIYLQSLSDIRSEVWASPGDLKEAPRHFQKHKCLHELLDGGEEQSCFRYFHIQTSREMSRVAY